jgi:putative FmdB family regulatory protein
VPLYGYICECGHEFSDVLKVSDRNKPKEEPCPSCGTVGKVVMQLSAPLIVAGVGDFRKGVPDVFKDRLREIKKSAGRTSTIDV